MIKTLLLMSAFAAAAPATPERFDVTLEHEGKEVGASFSVSSDGLIVPHRALQEHTYAKECVSNRGRKPAPMRGTYTTGLSATVAIEPGDSTVAVTVSINDSRVSKIGTNKTPCGDLEIITLHTKEALKTVKVPRHEGGSFVVGDYRVTVRPR